VAYRADIEIAVRGAQELKRLQNEIRVASDAVDSLNSNLSGIANLVPRSFDNLSKTVAQAAKSFNAAALETDEAATAARKYVQATDALNAGLRERISLLAKIRAEERITKPGDAGTGQQTPALPPQLIRTYEIGKNWVKFFQDAAEVAVDLRARSLNTQKNWNDFFATAAQAAVNVKANSLNTRKNWNDFFATAAQAAVNVKANSVNTKNSWNTFFTEAAQLANDLTDRTREIEGKNSAAARDRLAADAERRRNATPEVIRRPIAGLAAPEGMGPVTQFAQLGTVHSAVKAKYDAEMQFLTTITNIEREFDKQTNYLEIQAIQRELDAELDKIEIVAKAQKAADTAALKDFDARLKTRTATKGAAAKASSDRTAMMQNALIGGAFPMLFGGGAGAVLGGAAGGFIPGNPMMSIVTSALGTMVDEFAAAAIAVGAALMDTATTFDFVKEKSLFSSKELEKYATKLQEAGFVASASAVAQFDIIRKVGNKGVEDLATLASESDKLNRAFAELTVQMQAFIAGPLAVLLEQMAALVGQATTAQRAKVLEENLRAQGKTAAADTLASRVQGAQLKGLGQSFNFSNVDPLNPLSLVAPNTKATGNINEEIQGIINEFEKIELKPKIKLTPEQINKEDLAVLEKRLEAISIGKSLTDAVKQAAREQKDLDKQRADLVRSYEESIGSIRKKVEDEVSRRRFSILEKENQLLDLQGQNRIKQLQAANAQEIALAGRGERSEVASVAKEVAQIVANFTEQQLSAEEEAAKIKRKAALDARKFDFEAAQFKANIEKEVAKLNIETARRVADINEGARRRNEETDSRKFDIEKSIARIKIIQLKNELAAASFRADLDDVDKRSIQQSIDNLTTTQAVIKNLEPPAPLRGVGQVGGGGVSTTNFDAIVSKEKGAIQALVTEALKGIDLTVKGSREALAQNLLNVTDKIDQSLKDIETKEADAEVNRLRRIELINAGLTEGVAQRVMELEQLKKITLAQYDAIIAQVEGKIIKEATTTAQLATNEALRQEIELIKERKAALEGNLGTFDATTGTGTGAIGNATTSQAGKQIQEFITTATAELNNLEQVAINVSKGIGDAVGNSLANGITGLIEGTATAKEVFAGFLRDVGQILVQEGTKMIATYIAIGIAKIFAGMGGGGNAASALGSNPNVAAYSPLAKGGTFANGIATFAKGGTFSNSIVSSPTLFKFADGGTTRTGLMGEAGPEAIMPLKRGSDGSLGVQANGLREAMGRPPGGANGSPVLNMSFQSTTINGTEYVSRDQLEAAMAATRRQAAKEGANRGMNMTLDKIQNSPSTRSRVGIR
jgi:lambda family phage tail tape measure protein